LDFGLPPHSQLVTPTACALHYPSPSDIKKSASTPANRSLSSLQKRKLPLKLLAFPHKLTGALQQVLLLSISRVGAGRFSSFCPPLLHLFVVSLKTPGRSLLKCQPMKKFIPLLQRFRRLPQQRLCAFDALTDGKIAYFRIKSHSTYRSSCIKSTRAPWGKTLKHLYSHQTCQWVPPP
jgi:hypothetical protein